MVMATELFIIQSYCRLNLEDFSRIASESPFLSRNMLALIHCPEVRHNPSHAVLNE